MMQCYIDSTKAFKVTWLFGVQVNVLCSIKKVTLHQGWLGLGWVTVGRWLNNLGMQPATQINSVWPSLCR